jgi:hypothetical protein
MMKMNKKEFEDLFMNDDTYLLFFELADTFNLDKAVAFHKCNFCDYKTKTVLISELYEMDNAIANHLWSNHREICIKKAMEYQSMNIAKNNRTLDEVY